MKELIILCNGEPPSKQLLQKYISSAGFLIAADGGGNIALDMDIRPDVVIGDLDSFRTDQSHPFKVIQQADQETNDLEKALSLAYEKGAANVYILGATGQRLDHTLKNLSVLKQFNEQFNKLYMIDNFGTIQLLPSVFDQKIAVGSQISLFPLSGKVTGITTSGLKYPLRDEALENGVRDGSSNEVIDNPVQITYRQGDLLLFVADA
ncbi:thiamine diphosphokinase [Fodinibius salsisoli]|uniref:Thiamine diphosphokinase n=1 Tax=Fodinibius salsisoli TaxID=2820877 RepID=A0ABT3PM12_9BACT|nr:thiamine diphosphokinase [Fodinibius salsisoli]MCW9706985.1 thiamine diphosphokinase [Fodinibius salsisoli]